MKLIYKHLKTNIHTQGHPDTLSQILFILNEGINHRWRINQEVKQLLTSAQPEAITTTRSTEGTNSKAIMTGLKIKKSESDFSAEQSKSCFFK